MKMMYGIIAQELKSSQLKDVHPSDYLNFYCLGNREELHGGSKPNPASSNGDVVAIFLLIISAYSTFANQCFKIYMMFLELFIVLCA